MPPALHLQIIRTRWTKAARGGALATARARVPLSLPVASRALKRAFLRVETYRFGEPHFARTQSYQTELLDLSRVTRYEWGAFKLDWDGETATTHWRWSDYNVGAPEPKFRQRDIGHYEVAPDGWVRLRWHGRFRDYDGGQWWYEQTVVNIARCDGELSVDFSGTPGRSFEWLPNLR